MGPTDVEMVYGYLLNRHLDAARHKDEHLRARVYAAIELFEELWHADCAHWVDRFPGQPKHSALNEGLNSPDIERGPDGVALK